MRSETATGSEGGGKGSKGEAVAVSPKRLTVKVTNQLAAGERSTRQSDH
jgi:hypothetical protein